MTLSQRTILIIVSTFIALLFILAVTSDVILLKSFAALERVVVAENVQKVRNEIDESYDELQKSSREFSAIISSRGPSALNSLPLTALQNHHIDIVICFAPGAQGIVSRLAGRSALNNSHMEEPVLTQLGKITPLVLKATDEPLTGLVPVAGKYLQIVLSPLIDSDLQLLVGRYLDEDEVGRVTELTEFILHLIPVAVENNPPDIAAALAAFSRGEKNPVRVIDADTVAGYSLYTDLFGKPALIVKISEDRLLYKQGKVSIIYLLSSLFIAGAVFCFVMLFFIRGTILNRLASLTGKVTDITSHGDISVRLPLSDHQDELKDLAMSINGMLDSLENSENELRESEERYRMLFDRAPDAIIIIGVEGDEAGRIVSANQAAADQHGYTLPELLSMGIKDLNTVETNKVAKKITADIIAGEWVTTEVWHLRKDGTKLPVEIHAGLINIGGRKYILGFDRDITLRKIKEETDSMHYEQVDKLSEELTRVALDLAAANNELETFNYSVSHDMRGPLTRISGYCQLLLDDDSNLDPFVREYIVRIYESEIWLNDMIDAVLQLSQLTSTEITSTAVNLSEISEEVLRELSLENPERSVKTRIEPDIVVAGDSRLLKMVMINLLGNAWKYSSLKCEAIIEFGVVQTDSGLAYYVRDNGAGFEMNNAGKLFRVFSRLHDSSQFNGTGIGLATVQRIIFRHGGRIWAEAEPDIGATFYFTLP